MAYRIADLHTEILNAGPLASRCEDYRWDGKGSADVIIRADLYHPEYWPGASTTTMIYMESGTQFYGKLLRFQGMMLHASAVELNGKAYLFSGPCGAGKSTHTRLWQQTFGEKARVFNDDKPALRRLDGRWYAYGTPWCGKDGININLKVPLAGICFLNQSSNNRIRRLASPDAVKRVLEQTLHRCISFESLDLVLRNTDSLIREIPIFELENRPEPVAAQLSYETMRQTAEELGL